MSTAKPLLILTITAVLAGCAVGPDYHAPATTMPGGFATDLPTTRPITAVSSTQPIDIARWWQSLNDPALDSLINQAVGANLDLQIALARLQEARATEAVLTGGALPEAEFSGGAGQGSGSNSTKGRVSAPLNSATNTQGLKEITEVAGFDAGWELDLFGRYRREIEAARDDTQVAAEARNAILITLISDVARAYVDSQALELRLSLTRDNIRIEQQTYDLVQTRFNRGLTNELDVALASRQLATVQAQVAPLMAAIAAAQRRIAVLLGEFPEDLAAKLEKPSTLPKVPDQIAVGLPLALLRRRPDIRESERQLAAATARIGVATANLYPRLGVTAGIGFQGQGLGREPETTSFIWSAGPTAYWPLLDFGTLDAAIEVQDLRTRELLLNYRRTILMAVEEVDDAISNYAAQQSRLQSLGTALVASQRAAQLATKRYDRGLSDFLNVLDAQRQLYELQDQFASAQEAVVLQYIAVYKGLGGGWETYQSIPPIHHPQPAIIATFARIAATQPAQ